MSTPSDSMEQKARALAENLYYAPDDQISCDKFIDKVSKALVSFAASQVSEAVGKERMRIGDYLYDRGMPRLAAEIINPASPATEGEVKS